MPFTPVLVDSGLWFNLKDFASIGPFYRNGSLYGVFYDGTTNHTHEAWKSPADGSSWAEVDAANHPTSIAGGGGGAIGIRRVCELVPVLYVVNVVTPSLALKAFGLGHDLWGSEVTGGPVLQSSSLRQPAHIELVSLSGKILRSIYHGNGPESWSTYHFADYVPETGWGSATEIAASTGWPHSFPGSAGGAGDYTHCFFVKGDTGDLKHQSIAPDGTLGTVQTISGATMLVAPDDSSNCICTGGPIAYYDTEADAVMVAIPFVGADGALKVAIAVSADDPTWSIETVSSHDPTAPGPSGSSFVSLIAFGVAPKLYAVWFAANGSDTDIYYNSRANGGVPGSGVWSGDVLHRTVLSPSAPRNLSLGNVPSGIGLFWTDGGVGPYYDLIALNPCAGAGDGDGTGPYRVII